MSRVVDLEVQDFPRNRKVLEERVGLEDELNPLVQLVNGQVR